MRHTIEFQRNAHDYLRERFCFLFVVHQKLSRFRILKEKRKRFMSTCYNFNFLFGVLWGLVKNTFLSYIKLVGS